MILYKSDFSMNDVEELINSTEYEFEPLVLPYLRKKYTDEELKPLLQTYEMLKSLTNEQNNSF